MRHKRPLLALAGLIVVLVLTACTSGGASTPRLPTVPPHLATATPGIPAGTVLFQSDWSKGLQTWGNTTGWTVDQGTAQSKSSSNDVLTIPALLPTSNYVLEVRFQIVSVPANGGQFFLRAVRTTGRDGYFAGILNLLSPAPHSPFSHPQIQVYLDPMGDMEVPMHPAVYQPGSFWHTFRVNVQGPEVDFFADGISEGFATSSQTSWLSNSPLQIVSSGAVVHLSSVSITAG